MPAESRLRAGAGTSVLACGVAAVISLGGCGKRFPATLAPAAMAAPTTPTGFERLYAANCAGCHGADGTLGGARPLRDARYLASVSDETLTAVISKGSSPGTLMPATALSAGGWLSDQEISAIVQGLRNAWGKGGQAAAIPYSIADAQRTGSGIPSAASGERVFRETCAACHGVPPQSGSHAPSGGSISAAPVGGSVTDPFYLRMVSDQGLRSAIIFGRADLSMPAYDGAFPGHPAGFALTPQQVTDLVAWLAERREKDWPPGAAKGGAP